MLSMAMDSAKLFFAGKLFQDNGKVMRQLALAIVLGVVAIIVVNLFAPIWIATLVGGIISGFLQPILFKDLKYA